MITTGVFPDSFKISKIIPLFKKGDSSLLSNYRPISLLPTISKISERILYLFINIHTHKYLWYTSTYSLKSSNNNDDNNNICIYIYIYRSNDNM